MNDRERNDAPSGGERPPVSLRPQGPLSTLSLPTQPSPTGQPEPGGPSWFDRALPLILSQTGAGAAVTLLGVLGIVSLLPGDGPLPLLFGLGALPFSLSLLLGGPALAIASQRGWRARWPAVGAGALLFLCVLTLVQLGLGAGSNIATAGGALGQAGAGFLKGLFGTMAAWALALLASAVAAIFLWRTLPPGWTARLGTAAVVLARNMSPGPAQAPAKKPRAGGPAPKNKGHAAQNAGRAPAASVIRGRRDEASSRRDANAIEPARKAKAAGPTPVAPAPATRPAATTLTGKEPAGAGRQQQPRGERRPAAAVEALDRLVEKQAQSEQPRRRSNRLPPLDLLEPDRPPGAGSSDARQQAQILQRTLAQFGVPVEVVSIKEGPAVVQIGIEPGEVVRQLGNGEIERRRVPVKRIVAFSKDLALALAAPSLRIEAPVPGHSYVGIEVPKARKATVPLRGVLASRQFDQRGTPLMVALGRDVAGAPAVANLARMPHLLIAGATGSGKSVCINSIICSLLMQNEPEQLRLLLVDPKMVELPHYNGAPHLIAPVVTDVGRATGALAWLSVEMDRRYRLFQEAGARNVDDYNRKTGRRRADQLPYIVLVIDELADLMMTAGVDVERQLCRLAQISRATGIHLVVATQRPSVDVLTGLIKANFPARIAFAVTTQIDSRVVLDTPGAEQLLGRGDMLFMSPEVARLQRIQGCFVSDREISALVAHWREARPDWPEPGDAPWAALMNGGPESELLQAALDLIGSRSRVSISVLQRELRLGYPRAARLMEQLEQMGAVGEDEGAGRSREVLVDVEYVDEEE